MRKTLAPLLLATLALALAVALSAARPGQRTEKIEGALPQEVAAAGDGWLRVVVEARPGQAATAARLIRAHGGRVEATYANLVQASVPPAAIARLTREDTVLRVRRPLTFLPLAIPAQTGTVSQGVTVSGARSWHSAGFQGQGVKIAVIDFAFAGYEALVGSELPADVITRSFRYDGQLNFARWAVEPHGAGAAEIVYDMAPAAQLYLVNFETEVELGNAIDWLIAQGVDIISASWGNPLAGPGDGTGPLNDIINRAVDAGILWVNAAGNYADSHWSGLWSDPDNDGWLNFSEDDNVNTILWLGFLPILTKEERFLVLLKWDDPFGASCNDYDLFVTGLSPAQQFAKSENRQDCNSDPVEQIEFEVPKTGAYGIAIRKVAGTDNPHLGLYFFPTWFFVPPPELDYKTAASSITVPADNPGVLAVGAFDWRTPDEVEFFSSQGPTTDGRIKPDLIAADGVRTRTYAPGSFYGTSASAPLVAGAAALVKQANPQLSARDIQAFLEARAIDMGPEGKDNVHGAGRLSLGSPPTPTPTIPPPSPERQPLVAGWNNVVFTGPDGTPPDQATASITGSFQALWKWDAQASKFRGYRPDVPAMANDLAALDNLDAVWVLATSSTEWRIEPFLPLPASRTVHLAPGWNNVAFTGASGTKVKTATASIEESFDVLWRWDAASQRFQGYRPGAPSAANDLKILNQLDAVWVHVILPQGADWVMAGP